MHASTCMHKVAQTAFHFNTLGPLFLCRAAFPAHARRANVGALLPLRTWRFVKSACAELEVDLAVETGWARLVISHGEIERGARRCGRRERGR
eukprot:4978742-Pleurochrysis_carterae.AAC.1